MPKSVPFIGTAGGRAPQYGEGPALAAAYTRARSGNGDGEDEEPPGAELVRRRHPHWQDTHVHWQWLLDSYESGERYRNAVYGYERNGSMLVRNLIRHK